MSCDTPEWPPWDPCEEAGIAQIKFARVYRLSSNSGSPFLKHVYVLKLRFLYFLPDENICLNSVQLRNLHKTLQDYIDEWLY